MKLQLNMAGAWKNWATVKDANRQAVKYAADRLGREAFGSGLKLSWRLVDDDNRVVMRWTGPRGWQPWTTRPIEVNDDDNMG